MDQAHLKIIYLLASFSKVKESPSYLDSGAMAGVQWMLQVFSSLGQMMTVQLPLKNCSIFTLMYLLLSYWLSPCICSAPFTRFTITSLQIQGTFGQSTTSILWLSFRMDFVSQPIILSQAFYYVKHLKAVVFIKIKVVMGSDLNPDKQARIYVHINTAFTYAGQILQGCVYINCLSDRPYSRLDLRLLGQQKVYWSEGTNQNRRTYSNDRQTYEDRMVVATFGTHLQSGKHAFPFSLLLPNAMPSSLFLDSSNCIKYRLFAELIPSSSEKMQSYKKPIDVREPPRLPLGQGSIKMPVDQTCCCNCGCSCCMYGTAEMRIDSSSNVFAFGEVLMVKGHIDNTNGRVEVKSYEVKLICTTTMVDRYGRIRAYPSDLATLATFSKPVPSGCKEEFSGEVIIPPDLSKNYTAIGNIISRCYFLQLEGNTSCCVSNMSLPLHLIVTTSMAAHEQLDKPPQQDSSGYYMSQPVVFNSLRPYFYQPSVGINVLNQVGAPVHIPNENSFPVMDKPGINNNPYAKNHETNNHLNIES